MFFVCKTSGSGPRLATIVALSLVLAACGSAEETVDELDSVPVASTDDVVEAEPAEASGDDHGDEDEDDDDDHDDSSGLGSHEHGSAELAVAWIDADVVVDLISPTQNVFGFEYEPETEEDKSTEVQRTAALTTAGIIAINEAAGCELSEPATADVERDSSHSEITVSWNFSCANPDEIAEVDLSALFAEFPGFVDIDAEWVSVTSQSSAELSPQQPTLQLES